MFIYVHNIISLEEELSRFVVVVRKHRLFDHRFIFHAAIVNAARVLPRASAAEYK